MSIRILSCLLFAGCILVAGCSRQARNPDEGKKARPDNRIKVKAEMSVQPKYLSRATGGSLAIKVFITNLQDKVKTVEFESPQQYTVYAIDESDRSFLLNHLGGPPIQSAYTLQPLETRIHEVRWDGHVFSDGQVVYLPPGRYELEARFKKAQSNTIYVQLDD